ncbi:MULTISPECIES: zinc-binding alcohol dehydrogenase [unclassified Microbacterium]|uniref:zinc-binding alcohol dehydrogenase n=1 Tax=unclassified Microbacterium TaxID=2609290 RepID=UPI003018396A
MAAAGAPEWVVREDAGVPVLVALYVRQALGVRFPEELPELRGAPVDRPDEFTDTTSLDRQWRSYWEMTVEPQAHPSPVPLELVEEFDTLVALPTEGFAELAEAIAPLGAEAVDYARAAHARYRAGIGTGASYRAYASAIAQHERQAGRRAHSFELNVQVLPLTQRGVWWIGALTIAVTDSLRSDVVAFDAAIGPVIADIA